MDPADVSEAGAHPDGRRLLLVHAHPDDESIFTGATMARYAAEGARVTLVTCTLGEMGEIIPPELAHLAGVAERAERVPVQVDPQTGVRPRQDFLDRRPRLLARPVRDRRDQPVEWGRGAADDKGAIAVQLGAIAAYLKTNGGFPVNVKMLVEGEEEVGSSNLGGFFRENKERLMSDVIVVCA